MTEINGNLYMTEIWLTCNEISWLKYEWMVNEIWIKYDWINRLIKNWNEIWPKYDWMVNEIWLNCILNINKW